MRRSIRGRMLGLGRQEHLSGFNTQTETDDERLVRSRCVKHGGYTASLQKYEHRLNPWRAVGRLRPQAFAQRRVRLLDVRLVPQSFIRPCLAPIGAMNLSVDACNGRPGKTPGLPPAQRRPALTRRAGL